MGEFEDAIDESVLASSPKTKRPGFIASTIPGHFRAITGLAMIFAAVATYYATGRIWPVVSIEMAILGLFLTDQATHLAQGEHSRPAPTAIEQFMQRNKIFCQTLGLIIFTLFILGFAESFKP